MLFILSENIATISVILVCFVLGIIVYLKDPKSASHRLFILFCADTILWTITNYISLHYLSLFWMRLVMFFAVPQAFLFFLFVHTFPAEKIQLPKKIFLFLLVFIILVMILTLSPLLFSHLEYKDGQVIPVAGPAMLLFVIASFGSYFAGVFHAIKKLKHVKSKNEKLQWQLISFGLILTFLLVISFNFIAVVFFNESGFVRFGSVFFMPFIIGASIAITKYQLFGIKVILTTLLVTLIAILLLLDTLIFAQNLSLQIIKGIAFFAFLFFGYYLIKSVQLEIKMREEIEKLSNAKSEFISIASHQLRTPLTAIKGYISMILEGTYGQLSEKNKKPMENVYQSNERLIGLVNNLLNLSRLDAGKIKFDPKPSSLEEMIKSIIKELKVVIENKGLYIRIKKPASLLPEVNIDQDHIRQVILNIIDNAAKYTKKGGITIELSKINNMEEIKISDTGEGMNGKDLGNLFQVFSRATAGIKLHTEGTGLGLHVAKRFVEMHGGKIWAESQGINKGSSFIIQLPINFNQKLSKKNNL